MEKILNKESLASYDALLKENISKLLSNYQNYMINQLSDENVYIYNLKPGFYTLTKQTNKLYYDSNNSISNNANSTLIVSAYANYKIFIYMKWEIVVGKASEYGGEIYDDNIIFRLGISFKTISGEKNLQEIKDGIYFVSATGKIKWTVSSGEQTVNIYKGDILLINSNPSSVKKFVRISNYIYQGNSSSVYNEQNRCVQKSEVLTKDNTTAYTPTASAHPATKGYVDAVKQSIQSEIPTFELEGTTLKITTASESGSNNS